MGKILFHDKESKEKEELRDELMKRLEHARFVKKDSKETQFLLRVIYAVERGIYMEHNPNGTMHICPCCQKPMTIEHDVYCSNCGQLVK